MVAENDGHDRQQGHGPKHRRSCVNAQTMAARELAEGRPPRRAPAGGARAPRTATTGASSASQVKGAVRNRPCQRLRGRVAGREPRAGREPARPISRIAVEEREPAREPHRAQQVAVDVVAAGRPRLVSERDRVQLVLEAELQPVVEAQLVVGEQQRARRRHRAASQDASRPNRRPGAPGPGRWCATTVGRQNSMATGPALTRQPIAAPRRRPPASSGRRGGAVAPARQTASNAKQQPEQQERLRADDRRLVDPRRRDPRTGVGFA